jgi:hypothetical protein
MPGTPSDWLRFPSGLGTKHQLCFADHSFKPPRRPTSPSLHGLLSRRIGRECNVRLGTKLAIVSDGGYLHPPVPPIF